MLITRADSLSIILTLMIGPLGLGAQTRVAETDWLAVLPRSDRNMAIQLIASSDTALALYHGDRTIAVESEFLYAHGAYLFASRLDALGRARVVEDDHLELRKLRRFRWESAKELAEGTYQRRPGGDGDTIARAGRSLREFLAPRIAKLGGPQLRRIEARLAARLVGHPDTPGRAFDALRAVALSMETAAFRAWVLSLAEGTPRSLAEYGSAVSAAEFSRPFLHFSELYAARMLLRDLFPAAAFVSWYVDSAAGYGAVPDSASASLDSFLSQLGKVRSELAYEVLNGEPEYGRAFLELSSLLWVFHTRRSPGSGIGMGVDPKSLERVFRLLPSVPEKTIRMDYRAVERAESFAVKADGLVEDQPLLAAFGDFKKDSAALEALTRGARYDAVRRRLSRSLSTIAFAEPDENLRVDLPHPVVVVDTDLPIPRLESVLESGLIYLIVPDFPDTEILAGDALAAAFSGAAVRGGGGRVVVDRQMADASDALGIPAPCLLIPISRPGIPGEDVAALRHALLSVSGFRLANLLKSTEADSGLSPRGLR